MNEFVHCESTSSTHQLLKMLAEAPDAMQYDLPNIMSFVMQY